MKINKSLLIAAIIIILGMLYIILGVFFDDYSPKQENSNLVIGLIISDPEDEWKKEMYSQIQHDIKKNNMRIITLDTPKTQADQTNAIRRLITYQTDAIVFAPVTSNGWQFILEEAETAKIPIIALNEKISEAATNIVYHIGFDYDKIASTLAATLIESAKPNSTLLQLERGITSIVSDEIACNIDDAIVTSEHITSNYRMNVDATKSRAFETVSGLIYNNQPFDIIFSSSDAITMGCLDALEHNGITTCRDVRIYAIGGEKLVTDAFENGKISCLAYTNYKLISQSVADLLQALLIEKITQPNSILLDGEIYINSK